VFDRPKFGLKWTRNMTSKGVHRHLIVECFSTHLVLQVEHQDQRWWKFSLSSNNSWKSNGWKKRTQQRFKDHTSSWVHYSSG
jgi:hypothetical protein